MIFISVPRLSENRMQFGPAGRSRGGAARAGWHPLNQGAGLRLPLRELDAAAPKAAPFVEGLHHRVTPSRFAARITFARALSAAALARTSSATARSSAGVS